MGKAGVALPMGGVLVSKRKSPEIRVEIPRALTRVVVTQPHHILYAGVREDGASQARPVELIRYRGGGVMDGRETEEKQDVAIEPRENGPYRIRNLGRLETSKGERLMTKEVISLCRCGGSSNKPFCDGTHSRNGFSSANVSDRRENRRVSYVGARLTIHDNRGICSHAGHCTGGLPAVFNSERTPWIDPDGAPPEAVAEVVKRCPSGALSYSIDGIEHRDQEGEPMVLVSKDGPYYVTGGIALKDSPWGEEASREHYALCRCGGSKNKPFCDGTHWSIGFEDEKN